MHGMRIAGLAGLLSAMSALLVAAPPLTQVRDQLYKADGTPFTGMATISWRSFTAADSSNIPANLINVPVQGGVLDLKLVPTTNASNGAYYVARFNANGRAQFTEVWAVPPSALPVPVSMVRVSTTNNGKPPSLIQIADVTGLAEALTDRPAKALTYAAGRAAVIDAGGEITAAAGAASDCLRVDGTAGPCGAVAPVPLFVDMETPAGALNGTNAVFTLNHVPAPSASLHLYRNGILQKPGGDYTLSGNTITFASESVPQPGDLLLGSYRTAAP